MCVCSEPTLLELAEAGYKGYGDSVDWTNYAGGVMPTWRELPEPQREAWVQNVEAIRLRLLDAATGHRGGPRSAYEASHPMIAGRSGASDATPAGGCCKGAPCDGPGQSPQHVEVGDPRAGEPGGRA